VLIDGALRLDGMPAGRDELSRLYASARRVYAEQRAGDRLQVDTAAMVGEVVDRVAGWLE
jgi:hypothetical protein